MAKFDSFFDTLIKHEGGYVNDPLDRGGATNWGVTLAVWVRNGYDKNGDGLIDAKDIQLLTKQDAFNVAKKLYWDAVKADEFVNQSVAEFVFDWGYNSGPKTAIKKVQQIVGVKADGAIGPKTIAAINGANQEELFNKLKASREAFFRAIVAKNPSQQKFLKGWLNRNNSFNFRK